MIRRYHQCMIQHFLLDVDGTLVASNDAHAQAWVAALAEFGYETTYEQVRPLIGMGADTLMPSLFPDLSAESREGQQITKRRRDIFLHVYAPSLRPTRGARDLVRRMQEMGFETAIASSATNDELTALLRAARVSDLVKSYTTADDADRSKPHPDIIQSALKKNRWDTHTTVMVGDTPYDIEAAVKAQLPCIALRCGGFEDIMFSDAVAVYNDPIDMLDHLEQVTSAFRRHHQF